MTLALIPLREFAVNPAKLSPEFKPGTPPSISAACEV